VTGYLKNFCELNDAKVWRTPTAAAGGGVAASGSERGERFEKLGYDLNKGADWLGLWLPCAVLRLETRQVQTFGPGVCRSLS